MCLVSSAAAAENKPQSCKRLFSITPFEYSNIESKLFYFLKASISLKRILQTPFSKDDQSKVISVDGKDFEVLRFLGEGTQGKVYLVRRNGKKFTIKIFHIRTGIYGRSKAIEEAIVDMKIWASDLEQNDYPMRKLSILYIGKSYPAIVAEYIDGVTVADILNSSIYNIVPKRYRDKIRERYKKLLPNGLGRKENILLDLETGDFVLIDPY
jgi:serine/threonine protein kinase